MRIESYPRTTEIIETQISNLRVDRRRDEYDIDAKIERPIIDMKS